MKKQTLKIGKLALSLVVAFAIIAASAFTAIPGISVDVSANTATDTWDGTTTKPTTTDAQGNVVINTAEELAWVVLAGGAETNGVSYKVAANSVFDMNGMSGITMSSTVAEVKAAEKNEECKWDNESIAFGGNFDGNGLVVYNIYSNGAYAGLFTHVNPYENTASCVLSFKNVKVMASYLVGFNYAGGIVGQGNAPGTSTGLAFDSCEVVNCYISDNGDTNSNAKRSAAGIVGTIAHNKTTINNCSVINNDIVGTSVTAGFAAFSSDFAAVPAVSNSIIVGTACEAATTNDTAIPTAIANTTFTNVYTDQTSSTTGVTTLTTAQMQGAAAKSNMNLDWDVVWAAGAEGEYPYITYDVNYDVWDGTLATAFSDTAHSGSSAADAIVIANAEELAFLVSGAGGSTTFGKYYTVAPNTVFNMNGLNNITLASTLDQVKVASTTGNNWCNSWMNSGNTFGGIFDGNGLVVYNVYGKQWAAGLFPTITNTRVSGLAAEVKNVTVKNSWFESTAGAYTFGAAAIVGAVKNDGSGHPINISGCVVENCNIVGNAHSSDTTKSAALIIGDIAWEDVSIDNCLTLNNSLTHPSTATLKGGLVADTNRPISVSNVICIGNDPVATGVENTVTYTNVYTDQASSTAGVTTVAADNMKGAAAKTNMPGLDWSVWIAFDGELPDFRANHNLSASSLGAENHSISCSECGKSVVESHLLVENGMGTLNVCDDCGYSATITEKKTVTWDGNTKPTTLAESGMTGNGTEDEPYIIKTAAQLWYVAQVAGADSVGKYYKVAANVGTFDMQQKDWGLKDNNVYFQGIFDGNGAEIINFKANGWNIGLFPRVAGDVVIKNIKLSGAAVTSTGGDAGAIVGSIAATANVTISNCIVVDSTVSGQCAAGAIIGTAGAHTLVVDNCFVANNTVDANTKEADTEEYKDNAVIGYGHTSTRTLTNTIAIGNDPNIRVTTATNVYTDLEASYYGVTQISLEDIKGEGVVSELGLDSNVWFDTESYPELRVFHDLSEIAPAGAAGHTEACADCGITVASLAPHNYEFGEETATCEDCGYVCTHNEGDAFEWVSNNDGDCVTADTGRMVCSICEFSSPEIDNPYFEAGHSFGDVVPAVPPTCTEPGTIAYKTCSVCEENFATDAAEDAAFEDALETIVDPEKGHTAKEEGGEIVYTADNNTHTKVCSVCNEPFGTENHTGGDLEPNGAEGHTGSCEVCGYEMSKAPHNYEFGEETAICEDCGYECTHNDGDAFEWKSNNDGDCLTADTGRMVCSICEFSSPEIDNPYFEAGHSFGDVVPAVPPTCTEPGTIAYKTCSVCEKNYAADAADDAAFETAIEDVTVAATGHTFGDVVPAVPHTCTEDGNVAYKTCSVCEKNYAADAAEKEPVENALETVVDPAAHALEPQAKVPATEDAEGVKAHDKCTVCEKLFIDGEEVEAEDLVIEKLEPAIVAGWKQDTTGWWYQNADGSYPSNGWTQINGVWYYFNASGYMATGWVNDGGTWYYLDASGAMATGWLNLGGTWYYLDASGAMATGWLNLGGTWYYLDASGAMATGWEIIGGTWYYFYDSGAMAANCYIDGYWLTASGAMA